MKELELERTLGEELPFNIGTAYPLESLFKNKEPKYAELWFNLRTLFRNFWGSCKTPELHSMQTLAKAFLEDIKQMGIVTTNYNKKFVFYIGTENIKLGSQFPNAMIKLPKTDKQVHQNTMERHILALAVDELGDKYAKVINTRLIGPQDKAVIIMTHRPLDLLSQYQFGLLTLLESHTGKLKSPIDWNTKLKDKPYNMPFNILTLQVLGDGQQFTAQKKEVVLDFKKLADDKNWSPTTTMKKINEDLKVYKSDHISLYRKLATTHLG